MIFTEDANDFLAGAVLVFSGIVSVEEDSDENGLNSSRFLLRFAVDKVDGTLGIWAFRINEWEYGMLLQSKKICAMVIALMERMTNMFRRRFPRSDIRSLEDSVGRPTSLFLKAEAR